MGRWGELGILPGDSYPITAIPDKVISAGKGENATSDCSQETKMMELLNCFLPYFMYGFDTSACYPILLG